MAYLDRHTLSDYTLGPFKASDITLLVSVASMPEDLVARRVLEERLVMCCWMQFIVGESNMSFASAVFIMVTSSLVCQCNL